MSFLRTATASSSRAATGVRALSTSAPAAAAPARRGTGPKNRKAFELNDLETYAFDDAPALGHLRLIQIDRVRELVSKMKADKAVLAAQARPFKQPKGKIRVTSVVDLSSPSMTNPSTVKRVLVAPLSSLPLKTPEAIQRVKLLAGPRWSPGYPGRNELVATEESKEGYIKIAEDRFPDGRMNRKAVSDMLERLVTAANDPKSPIPADTPVDMRHLEARQQKKKERLAGHLAVRVKAMERRPEVIGGVRGFPKEWLSAEAQAKIKN